MAGCADAGFSTATTLVRHGRLADESSNAGETNWYWSKAPVTFGCQRGSFGRPAAGFPNRRLQVLWSRLRRTVPRNQQGRSIEV